MASSSEHHAVQGHRFAVAAMGTLVQLNLAPIDFKVDYGVDTTKVTFTVQVPPSQYHLFLEAFSSSQVHYSRTSVFVAQSFGSPPRTLFYDDRNAGQPD